MHSFLVFIVLIASWCQESLLIKGQVTLKGSQEGMPGVRISVLGQAITTLSDMEGSFVLQMPTPDSAFTILLEYESMPVIQLNQVMAKGKDTLQIGRIELIYNRMIPALTFLRWKNQASPKVQPVYHNATLLGYLLKNEVEETDLRSNCLDQDGKPYYYQYDAETNSLRINYSQLKECR